MHNNRQIGWRYVWKLYANLNRYRYNLAEVLRDLNTNSNETHIWDFTIFTKFEHSDWNRQTDSECDSIDIESKRTMELSSFLLHVTNNCKKKKKIPCSTAWRGFKKVFLEEMGGRTILSAYNRDLFYELLKYRIMRMIF